MLLRRAQRPEGNWSATKLGKPALKLRLGSVVRKARHVEDLTPLRQKGTNISTSIHRASKDVRVLMGRLRLANKTPQHPSERHGLLHCPTRRCGSQGLKMEREIVLDRGARLHGLHLERRTDVREQRRAKGERLGVVLLPALILCSEIKGSRVLKVRRKDHSLVTSFPGKLDTKVPSIQSDENKVETLGSQVLIGKRIEPVDRIPKRSGISYVFPCKSGQAR